MLRLVAIFLCVLQAHAQRPLFSDKNATEWRKTGVCEGKMDCPTYFDCYNTETGVLTESSPGSGHCNCYAAISKAGDDCQDRAFAANITMLFYFLIIGGDIYVFCKAIWIIIRLKQCNALDLKKPGNQTLALVAPTTFFLFFYQFALLMSNCNMDAEAFYIDKVRRLATAGLILFLQLCSLQIAITWITIGGTAGKKNVQFKDYPKNIKTAYYVCQALKGLTVVILLICGALNMVQALRMYTFLQFMAISVFYWFGSNKLSKILTPNRGQGMTDEKYDQMRAPAIAIRKCGHNCCRCCVVYLILQAAASPFIQNVDYDKGNLGMWLFETSLFVAVIMFNIITEYCRFGVRKTLAKGKESGGWGAATTVTTTAVSGASVAPE
ncbi:hypothetical protein TrLO_g15989 [Triparma laevis f. longispina]|uniref:EGF-like domain-containing protein n=1 Tax=Triparma laevis f. longispina TaxID=1714387 RepID=A0A9W7EF60_9STRA|nr:hypothetical protein TrLO_g15989 [Triparma laevis f. longispina]